MTPESEPRKSGFRATLQRIMLWPSGRRLADLPCPVCGAKDRNCVGKVTSACGTGR